MPTPSPSPSTSETDSPSPSQPDEIADWSTDAPADPRSPGTAEPSDTPSTGNGLTVSKAGLRATVGMAFRKVCRVVAAFVAIEEERELGVWEPDEDDVRDVARPATNLIYRRLPDEARGGDVIDIVALGLALAGYVGKNLQKRARVRTALILQAQQGDMPREGATP